MFTKNYIYSVFTAFLLLFTFNSCIKEKEQEIKPIRYIGNYNKDFNDKNDLHLQAAHNIGIAPIENREKADLQKKQLKEVKSCKNYEIDKLTHSIPFVVPEAELLLQKIGDNFADSLKNLNAPHYKLIVTSITRTKDDVKRLGQKNINASVNSAHMYGTTIDISWKRFIKDSKSSKELSEEQLKMILASVLRDLRKENVCYIKHEKKQACFHITAK